MTGPRPRIPSIQYHPTTLPDPKATNIDVPVVDLFVDPGRIEPTLFTKHKTTFRDDYSDARARVGLTPTTPFLEGEVLLVNQRDEVLGGGFTTGYFWRNGSYVTPTSSSSAKIGVSRRWALENINVQEGVVLIRDVLEGEHFWLSSAVSGFCREKVRFINEAM
ncbi:hypothetical protein G7054_g13845 [Neopestalotiopsis clavispora]|nr:hypothetical protein G7054_g13845 [Neopestalotiopsis clavispora]